MDRRQMMGVSAAMLAGISHSIAPRSCFALPRQDSTPTIEGNGQVARGRQYAVATVNEQASKAAMTIFAEGGNAVDAAIAAGLMLSVVDGFNSGLGGGCFILAKQANGKMLAIDGRETAPAASTATMFMRNGVADPSLSQTGSLASGTPGRLPPTQSYLMRWGPDVGNEPPIWPSKLPIKVLRFLQGTHRGFDPKRKTWKSLKVHEPCSLMKTVNR